MDEGRGSGSEKRSGGDAGDELSTAALLAIMWDALADLLGTAATATLIRRAAQRAARRYPELGELVITRKELNYHYYPPPSWNDRKGDQLALRELVAELRPLLVDLTGAVVINHLARIPEIGERGLISADKEES